jgi:putative transcriptional regulator
MGEAAEHRIAVHLDDLLAARGMTLVELSARVGVTVANLSILKNGHARALRFSTLTAICDALDCTPGDLLSLQRKTITLPEISAAASDAR